MSNAIEVTDATFAEVVMKSTKPVLVDYWADWCAPCKQLSPIVEEIAAEYADRLVVAKMDTNANPQVATQQGVLSLPTLQVWVNGQVVKSLNGARSKGALMKALDEYL